MSVIRQNTDGTPWTAVRLVAGTPILMTAISDGAGGWTEVDAWQVTAMMRKATAQPAPEVDRAQATAKQLQEIVDRYALGTAR